MLLLMLLLLFFFSRGSKWHKFNETANIQKCKCSTASSSVTFPNIHNEFFIRFGCPVVSLALLIVTHAHTYLFVGFTLHALSFDVFTFIQNMCICSVGECVCVDACLYTFSIFLIRCVWVGIIFFFFVCTPFTACTLVQWLFLLLFLSRYLSYQAPHRR